MIFASFLITHVINFFLSIRRLVEITGEKIEARHPLCAILCAAGALWACSHIDGIAAKAEKSDSVIIGEVWEDAVTKNSYGKMRNYALGYSLDSVMNYPFRSAVIDFALGKKTAFELRDFLLGQYHNYPQPMYRCLMNLLGSHDVERLHTAACRIISSTTMS